MTLRFLCFRLFLAVVLADGGSDNGLCVDLCVRLFVHAAVVFLSSLCFFLSLDLRFLVLRGSVVCFLWSVTCLSVARFCNKKRETRYFQFPLLFSL